MSTVDHRDWMDVTDGTVIVNNQYKQLYGLIREEIKSHMSPLSRIGNNLLIWSSSERIIA